MNNSFSNQLATMKQRIQVVNSSKQLIKLKINRHRTYKNMNKNKQSSKVKEYSQLSKSKSYKSNR